MILWKNLYINNDIIELSRCELILEILAMEDFFLPVFDRGSPNRELLYQTLFKYFFRLDYYLKISKNRINPIFLNLRSRF